MQDATLDLVGVDLDSHATPREAWTSDIPGTGGVIKQRPEDFVVEELPMYEPSGEGEHAYLTIRRRMMATLDVVRLLSTHFHVPRRSIGYAGLKDKHAVTTQVFSIRLPTSGIEEYAPLATDRLEVLSASRHLNKLRRGHLKGNRFVIRIRDVDTTQAPRAQAVLDRLARDGAPARFGVQRFGHLERNHLAGRALLLGDCRQFLDMLLGPCASRPASQQEGRQLYASGDYRGALEAFPTSLRPELAALKRLAEGASPEKAAMAIGRVERSFFGSALQSAIFNIVLDRRLESGTLGTLLDGDIAMTHPHRALVNVDEQVLEAPDTQPRLDALELSPTGPMWGRSLRRAAGRSAQIEIEALASLGLTPEHVDDSNRRLTGPLEGARRPLRIPVQDHRVDSSSDEHGDYIECAFTLPRGAFATTILEEVMKTREGP